MLVSLFSGKTHPNQSLSGVFVRQKRNGADKKLRVSVALIAGCLEPFDRLVTICRNALAQHVHPAKITLGFCIAMLGSRRKFLQRCRVILLLVGALGRPKISRGGKPYANQDSEGAQAPAS